MGDLTTRPQGMWQVYGQYAPPAMEQDVYPAMPAGTPAQLAAAAPMTPCQAAALAGRPLSAAGLPAAAYTPVSQGMPGMVPAAMQAPAGNAPSVQIPMSAAGQPPAVGEPPPYTVTNPYYFAGKLNQFVGKLVRVEFVLGTSGAISDRIGILTSVGASYITLQPLATDDVLICDLYSIKFVTVFLGPAPGLGAT